MNPLKISIITPSFNQASYLEQTILSIINQGYENLEYIIIDGGSTDNSVEIIKKYSDKLTYWISEKDRGQTDAINKGFRMATGEVVGWINSDDILLPESLKKIANTFLSNPKANIVTGWTVRIDADNKIIFNHYFPRQIGWLARKGVFPFSQQSWFWKREMFEYIGYLDESCHACMDVEFMMRQIMSKPKIIHIPEILSGFRQHELTKTAQDGDIWVQDRAKLKKKYRILNYRQPQRFAWSVYGIIKILNGNYLKQYLFKKKWGGRVLGDFLDSKGLHYVEQM